VGTLPADEIIGIGSQPAVPDRSFVVASPPALRGTDHGVRDTQRHDGLQGEGIAQ
jgi:hypothetical protein